MSNELESLLSLMSKAFEEVLVGWKKTHEPSSPHFSTAFGHFANFDQFAVRLNKSCALQNWNPQAEKEFQWISYNDVDVWDNKRIIG